MNLRYNEQVKDYLHPHLHGFINDYRAGDIISLPLYHGCNRVNRNGTRKEIAYNLGYQCVVPTWRHYWRKTKDKYKRKINGKLHWTRYMTRTNRRYLFKNKVTLFIIISLKSTNIYLKLQCVVTLSICSQ